MRSARMQVCQIAYFQTKNPNLGTFWMALELKKLALTPLKQTGTNIPCHLVFWKDNNSGIKM
jgi:hypothetical protein